MPQEIRRLTELLDLEQLDTRLFRGDHDQTSRQRTFGGLVMAQALGAAARTVEEDRRPHSLHAYFLRPGRADLPIVYEVEVARDGGSFSQRRVAAIQNGEHIFQLAASFQVPEDGLDHQDRMPPAPDPESCPRLSDVLAKASGQSPDLWEQEWGVLDVRYVGDSAAPGSRRIDAHNHRGHARVWVRVDGQLPEAQSVHEAAVAYASDLTLLSISVMPHNVRWGTRDVQAASLDHVMWFHRPIRADQWWLYDQTTPSASNARGLAMGRIFQDGELVATCAQEGLIRVTREVLEGGR
ncbi:acyl-CoA thioesterase II [Mariniluteicoccus endophyticus]